MFKDLFKKRRSLHIPGDAELRNLTSVNPGLAALYLEEAMGARHPTWPLHVAHWGALVAFLAFLWWSSFAWDFPYQYLGACAVPAFMTLCLSYSSVPFRRGLRRPSTVLAISVASLSAYVVAFLFGYAWISSSLEAEKAVYLAAPSTASANILLSFSSPFSDGKTYLYSYETSDGRHYAHWSPGFLDCRLESFSVKYAASRPGIHAEFLKDGDCE